MFLFCKHLKLHTSPGFRRPAWSCDGTTGQARGAGGLVLRWNFRGHEGLLDGLAGDFSWLFRSKVTRKITKNHPNMEKVLSIRGVRFFFGRHFLKSSLSLLHLIQYYPCRRGLRRVSHWSLMYLGYSRPEEMIKFYCTEDFVKCTYSTYILIFLIPTHMNLIRKFLSIYI